MILQPTTPAERILALDICKGHRVTVSFENGRSFAGRLRGHGPAGGSRRWNVGGYIIGHLTLKSIEIEV